MLKNYFLIALRNLLRYKLYSVINIFGLAVGMTCVILIAPFVYEELNYDGFHENGGQIYRILRETRSLDGSKIISAGTSGGLAEALQNEFPELEHAVRKMSWQGSRVSANDRDFIQRFCYADPNILDVFTFPLLKGDSKTALQKTNAVLITEETAQKFFGDEDPIGKTMTVTSRYFGGVFEVTGVLKNIPRRSHFRFDLLSSTANARGMGGFYFNREKWTPGSSYRPIATYIKLANNASADVLAQKLPDFMARQMGEKVRQQNTYYLQPFRRIYLHSHVDYGTIHTLVDRDLLLGDIRRIYAFVAVAGFILLLACINFMNLTTARSANRAKEVGLRKVVGANRKQLMLQFIGETVLMSFFALCVALCLSYLLLPMFNGFVHKNIALSFDVFGVTAVIGFTLLVGVLAGAYPAFFLSAFQPAVVLKGGSEQSGVWIRKVLVTFQFCISIVLLVSTGVVYDQAQYMTTKKLGFNKHQTITLHTSAQDRIDPHVFRSEFLKHPDVLNITRHNWFLYGQQYETVRPEDKPTDNHKMYAVTGDSHFLSTFDLELVAGRDFSEERATDRREAVILNEAAVKQLGWTDPIGKGLYWEFLPDLRVVGVVKDFHTHTLHDEIKPVFIVNGRKARRHTVKVRTDNLPEVLAFLEKTWQHLLPDRAFRYSFVDAYIDQLYQNEKRLGRLFGTFSLLAIFISCLGLFGLAAFTAEKRTKEIGIRKVLGASVFGIAVHLSRDIVKVVALSNVIAWPIAYWMMNQWLENFAYRITLDLSLFVLSGIAAFVIAFVTVGYQALKAARANPIDALRYE